ncbi:hypothetical protein N9591_02595 [Flavobacteriaceae bacterium]|jgi:hypothetical protein|nr:hypothetical protein [Flavobacteriaceae bacterium]|tara:strand:+ start:99 stop:413 length:315 start_codon:yes stop_codon:yes gene_type:complete
MKNNILILTSLFFIFSSFKIDANIDCIWGAKDKSGFKVLETGYGAKIYFSGGYSDNFIIKLDGSLYSNVLDEVYFIKDEFCDWEDDVIVINDEVFGVQKVTKVD